MKILATAVATGALLAVAGTLGFAGSPACGARNDIVKKLSETYHESPQSVGIVNKNAVIEVFVSEKGTFTIIASGTDGMSCILTVGDDWETNVLASLPGA